MSAKSVQHLKAKTQPLTLTDQTFSGNTERIEMNFGLQLSHPKHVFVNYYWIFSKTTGRITTKFGN